MTRGLLVIGLLAMLVGCVALVGLVNTLGSSAVQDALASGAADGQRVTAVCVGLNIGSCRVAQSSTSTRPAGDDGDGIPLQVKLLAAAVLCPLMLAAALWLAGGTEEW